ncbi:glycosyltransferase family 4 protein [Gelidibacter gilvus]|uniref:Glycosyltransferase family 1 protein n=1 Tax=Gelidibacter gilvus TaxID=59602 RepID=A0A4Q0XEW0_9FLAO|nr:glycosyltransferase family 4 protein [Gelidibacter gilvus]RXJ45960.1 glycosyltransferase family 1 protein [Gelidibacter gilvus]
MKKIIRVTTIPGSIWALLKGQLHFMSNYYEVIGISSKTSDFYKISENEGVRTIPVEMTRTITPLRDLIGLYKLFHIFKKEKPFIVHTHTPKAGTLGMFAAKLAGVPHRLHTVAGLPLLETDGFKRELLNRVEKLTYTSATLILPNSFALKDIIINQNFCKEDKLKVIANGSSNGIDTDHYDLKKVPVESVEKIKNQLKIRTSDTVFLFIGRIVKDKGINELILAFNEITNSHDNVQLILVGYKESDLDPISPESEFLIVNNPKIHEVGNIKDIRPYVALSNVLTFPSYREGFPNVVLQASCMEKPCIVTDINGCNEIIKDNYNGLIIPTKDSMALRDAMLKLHNNPQLTQDLAKNARPNIINKYQRSIVWEELLDLYNNLN